MTETSRPPLATDAIERPTLALRDRLRAAASSGDPATRHRVLHDAAVRAHQDALEAARARIARALDQLPAAASEDEAAAALSAAFGDLPAGLRAAILAEPAARPELAATTAWDTPPPPRQWLVRGWLPAARVALLTGPGKVGKSRLALQLAVAVANAADRRWIAGQGAAIKVEGDQPGTVVFATWEDEPDEIGRRLGCWPYLAGKSEPYTVLDQALEARLHAVDMRGRGPVWGKEELRRLVRRDPEMLDLALGTLFHYDP